VFFGSSLPAVGIGAVKSAILKVRQVIRFTAFMRKARWAVTPVGVLAFWGGVLMAASRYPSKYDWRYIPLSRLFSAHDDPAGHLWAAAGMVLCGVCLSWWVLLAQRWTNVHSNHSIGLRALLFASFCMACVAIPASALPWHKGHEVIAIAAFSGLCVGIVLMSFQMFEGIFLRRKCGPVGNSRLYASGLAGASILPMPLAGLAQLYVHYALPALPWVNLSWRASGVPVYLSFAFWEWITCFVLSGYMTILGLAAGRVWDMRLELRS
jgi:hypothetical protein